MTVDLDDELHRKLKVVAVMEGLDMTEIVRKLIEEYVKKAAKRKLIVLPPQK